ncbi:MAG: molybdenum ABC transporter ATP-binding protein [Porticoccaceae bacterium]
MLELDFEFRRGDFCLRINECLDAPITGVLGPSGCGKSTLLAVIAGLVRPQRGRIALDGIELVGSNVWLPPHRRRIGLVFQDNQLFPHLNVRNNLLYGYRNLAKAERRFSLEAVVALLEITDLLDRRPRQLSGGECQRVTLGRAILYAPRLLLLDEPLSSLDERLKEQILPFLLRIHGEFGIPMVYVSHARSEVEYLTTHWLVMAAGQISHRGFDGASTPVPAAQGAERLSIR